MKEVKINSKTYNKNEKDRHIIFALILALFMAPYTYEVGVSVGGIFGRMFF